VADETHSLSEGAGGSAPTAPHATPAARHGRATGPERFWGARWRRLIGCGAVVLSLGVHYVLAPWSLLPKHDFEIRDTAGDLAIPIDILAGEEAPAPPPPPPAEPPPAIPPRSSPEKGDALDAGVPASHPDAAPRHPPRDGGPDAAPRRAHDASTPPHDAQPRDAPPREAGVGLAVDAAIAHAGQVSGVARDAVSMIGAAGGAQAGPQNVIVAINMAVIRTHPVGARIGPLFSALPQWDDFLVGTGVDPLRDTDWVSINGPSLVHSDRDVIMVHYSASDALVDRALDVVGRKTGNGGPYDAGVPGMKAILGHADRADRVFMRPQPHVLAVVPPYYAATAAKLLAHATISRTPKRPTEAMRLTLIHPHGPMPAIPESVTELRLWIIPRNADGGADVYAEGDTASPGACSSAVDVLRAVIRDQNSFGVKLVTHGLLDGVALTADGSTVRMHIPVARDQLEVLLAFAAGRLGVDLVPLDAGVAPAPPPPPRH
jgi:hypothetical protein